MKITKLHLILIIIFVSGGIWARSVYRQIMIEKKQKELELLQLQQQERIKRQEMERKLQLEYLEKRKLLANEAIAIAGEYWKIAKKEGRDLKIGQTTLKSAKEIFGAGDYEKAWELANQAIKELKEAKPLDKKYTVKRSDNLWRISSMRQHFGNGKMWKYIYCANKNKIKNPRRIFPKQTLIIPITSWQNYKKEVATIK